MAQGVRLGRHVVQARENAQGFEVGLVAGAKRLKRSCADSWRNACW
jgi:hypothetical protein